MSEFYYAQTLDRKEITQGNLQAMFNDITARVNTNKHDIEQFRRDSVRYKHLKKPFRIFASVEKTGSNLISGLGLDLSAPFDWTWTLARLKHEQTVATAPNGTDSGHPVIHIMAQMYSHDWEPGAYEIGIGYSVDDGSSFTYWPNTNSFFGATRAHTNPMWSNLTTHYHTGATTNYWPGSMYGKREAHAVLGASDFSFTLGAAAFDITTVTDWAIGIRVNYSTSNGNGSKNLHVLDTAKLTLIARDRA